MAARRHRVPPQTEAVRNTRSLRRAEQLPSRTGTRRSPSYYRTGLEEDAPTALAVGGDDGCLEDDAPGALAPGGEDDCVGGGCSEALGPRW